MTNKIRNLLNKVKPKKDFVVLDAKEYNELMKEIKFLSEREKF